MKNLIVVFLVFASLHIANAQNDAKGQDPKAKEILDKVSEKTKAYKTLKVEFSNTFESQQKKSNETNQGSVQIKGTKYKLIYLNTEIYCDGKTIWSYLKEAQEVNIKNANQDDESVLNPAQVFTIYDKGFKYKYIGEKTEGGKTLYEIDLYPLKPAEKNYSRVKLLIDKDKLQLTNIKTFGKDGNNYTIAVSKFTSNDDMPDTQFIFDTKAHKGVEVNDLRE